MSLSPIADASHPLQHAPLVSETERLIAPAKRRIRLRDLPGTASVTRVLAARDFKVKYKQSILGPLWLVFQPLALLLAFLVAFKGLGNVNGLDVPYIVFALCGLCVWAFFQASMTMGTASMISNVNLVKYTPCPRVAPMSSAVISSLPSFAITGSAAVLAAAITGHLSPRVVLLPLALVWLLVLTFGIVSILASVAVRYRDVMSALPFLLQLGTFLAPVGYPLAKLSPKLRTIVELNPLTGLIEAVRWMILSPYHENLAPIAISLGMTVLVVTLGWRTFTRHETTMADVI
jgi:lipopolysaccharide transport system permease protein